MPIKFEQVTHTYPIDKKHIKVALDNVSVELAMGKMIAIIGTTGSGKSTFVQHLNGLLLPEKGQVEIDDFILTNDSKQRLKELRKRVGLVFQFPEYQLFEETVGKDIAFGPKNFNVEPKEIEQRVNEPLAMVNLPNQFKEVNPLDLSGGQKRRVAIAGVLAMRPDILVLDEPTAGLDPTGALEMMQLFRDYNLKFGKTVILVTHDMDNVLNYCDDVLVLHEGKLVYYGDKLAFFNDKNLMEQAQVLPPTVIQFRNALMDKGLDLSQDNVATLDQLVAALAKRIH